MIINVVWFTGTDSLLFFPVEWGDLAGGSSEKFRPTKEGCLKNTHKTLTSTETITGWFLIREGTKNPTVPSTNDSNTHSEKNTKYKKWSIWHTPSCWGGAWVGPWDHAWAGASQWRAHWLQGATRRQDAHHQTAPCSKVHVHLSSTKEVLPCQEKIGTIQDKIGKKLQIIRLFVLFCGTNYNPLPFSLGKILLCLWSLWRRSMTGLINVT